MLHAPQSHYWEAETGSSRGAWLAVTIALHTVAIVLLMSYEPIRSALTDPAPIMVSLINPVIEKPKQPPKVPPVRTTVKQPKPLEPLPLLTTVSEAPAPATLPPPAPPPPAAPVEVVAPKVIAAETPAPVLPVTPPNFNADYLDNPPPAYPAASRRLHEQGRVVLRVLVTVNGTADRIELKASSGSSRLDDAALDTVKRWRFVPARQGNQPVAAWVLIPITFTLKG